MSSNKEYYVFFINSRNWLQRLFLKKGFGHTFLITKDNYNWSILDPTRNYLSFEILAYEIDDNIIPMLMNNFNAKCIKVIVNNRTSNETAFDLFKAILPRSVSCVTLVKYILGINIVCWTPCGLFKKLLKRDFNKIGNNIELIEEIKNGRF